MITIPAKANESVANLQERMKISDRKMGDFVSKSYKTFQDRQDVKLCFPLLKSGDKYGLNALYTVLLYNFVSDAAYKYKNEKSLKMYSYKKEIAADYVSAINYCTLQSSR